jgi:hypothetical protein
VADGRRFYFYGNASLDQQKLPFDSELFKQYKPYQLIGVEDIDAAEKDILKRRKEFLDQGDVVGYNRFVQNNPITEEEIFRKTTINNFNSALINEQREKILHLSHHPYVKYKLEWARDDQTGMVKQPREVKLVVLQKHEDQSECVWIVDGVDGIPQRNFTNRYCAGIDSYNLDTTKKSSSKSLGGMCVLDRQTKTPVAVIRCRPRVKELFYELCLKLSVYYNMHNNVLGDVASDGIMGYFSEAGCYGYLADRPKKFEALNSDQMHPKWVRLTTYSKPLMVGVMQFHLNNHYNKIWFPELLDEIASYDEIAKESDNDLADAYGIALMQDISFDIKPRDDSENTMPDRFDIPQFIDDGQGGLKLKGKGGDIIKNIQQDSDLFGMMFGNPK